MPRYVALRMLGQTPRVSVSGRVWWCLALSLVVLLWPERAEAYPWMIRHHYTPCSVCHFDPSGAGPLTNYGRAIGDSILASPGIADDAESKPGFFFGAVETPEWLTIGVDGRLLWLGSKTRETPMTKRLIYMQADASATIDVSNFVALGTLGFAADGALGAALTRSVDNNLVSRQHWLGYHFAGPGLMVRAGRMNLPYGLRTLEHTLWIRSFTGTDINDDQQYGASLSFSREMIRGEVMAIAGNFQLRPDDYRERGYSAFVEVAPWNEFAAGVSSLITHRKLDTVNFAETWRHAHGVFARWATPWQPLVVQGEYAYALNSSRGNRHRRGNTLFLQADLEFSQGMHFLASGETHKFGTRQRFVGYSGWLSYWWFFTPRADLRIDGIFQKQGSLAGKQRSVTLLVQGHIHL
jgi:hypothetical protein